MYSILAICGGFNAAGILSISIMYNIRLGYDGNNMVVTEISRSTQQGVWDIKPTKGENNTLTFVSNGMAQYWVTLICA